jgi:alpha-1,4-galacturonosyltransferase
MHMHCFQVVSKDRKRRGAKADEVENAKACQLEFGSYCLWSTEHKVIMKDSVVKRLKDQLFVARSYYPSIAKLQGQEILTQEMKQNIQDHERVLSASAVDADLPSL